MNQVPSRPIRTEEPLDPGQRIVDAHHHLYHRPGIRYMLDEYLADVRSGHDVRATVFVQARAMLRANGPEAMRPVGETEFAANVAERCASGECGGVRVCDAIVAEANLLLGDRVRPVLEAHLAAGRGRVRGIRQVAAWDIDASLLNPSYQTSEDMLATPAFRSGFAQLGALGLRFDAWLYFPQLPRLAALARAFPDVPIALNHCGGIVGIKGYAGQRSKVHEQWSRALRELSACPNVVVKLGGLGMPLSGFGFEARDAHPSSAELTSAWRPWMELCIEAFGSERCMFESNFPADRGSYAYGTGWNAMKRIAASASDEQKADLFWRSATRFYGLETL